jgi:hypothetical protein
LEKRRHFQISEYLIKIPLLPIKVGPKMKIQNKENIGQLFSFSACFHPTRSTSIKKGQIVGKFTPKGLCLRVQKNGPRGF